MPWEVEYKPEDDTVVVTAAGQISGQEGKEQAERAIWLLKENQATLVLIDYSEAMSELSLAKLYQLPGYFSELDAPWHARIAVLLPRTGYRMESYQFFELACKNAGYNVKLFAGKIAAKNWLQHGQPTGHKSRSLDHRR